jgi:hypothetical protein
MVHFLQQDETDRVDFPGLRPRAEREVLDLPAEKPLLVMGTAGQTVALGFQGTVIGVEH